MAAWNGWASDVLHDIPAAATAANLNFLNEWHVYEESSCANNPLSTTLPVIGSSDCVHVSGATYVQSYPTTGVGAAATASTLNEHYYTGIVAALKTGDPFTYSDTQTVAAQITTWGTPNFAAWYLLHAGSAGGATGGGTTTTPTRTMDADHGWSRLMHAMSRTAPANLSRSGVSRRALRKLSQAGRK